MATIINPLLSKKNSSLRIILFFLFLFSGCNASLLDSNTEMADRKWAYRNHVIESFEIKDNSKAYNVYFKLRHTAAYQYSNIFILAHFKDGKNKVTKRYQYKLAKNDGEWLGSGSGNVFTHTLPLFSNHYFPRNGKFEIEIEQNMRDNPLLEISDVGILVEEAK